MTEQENPQEIEKYWNQLLKTPQMKESIQVTVMQLENSLGFLARFLVNRKFISEKIYETFLHSDVLAPKLIHIPKEKIIEILSSIYDEIEKERRKK